MSSRNACARFFDNTTTFRVGYTKNLHAVRGRDQSHLDLLQCLLNFIEIQLQIALVAIRSHTSIFEPRRRSLVISPYGTMGAVEGTSDISVPMHYCSAKIVLVGGLCGKLWSGLCHSPKLYPTNLDSVLFSLQNRGYPVSYTHLTLPTIYSV